MKSARNIRLMLIVLLIAVGGSTHAQTVKLLAAGPSSISQRLAVATVNKRAGPGAHHWTGAAHLVDQHSPGKRFEGTLWIVWSSDGKSVWAYLGLDSIPEPSATEAKASYKLQIDTAVRMAPGQNRLLNEKFKYGDTCPAGGQKGNTCDSTQLPDSVATPLSCPESCPDIYVVSYDAALGVLHCTACCGAGCGPSQIELIAIWRLVTDPSFSMLDRVRSDAKE